MATGDRPSLSSAVTRSRRGPASAKRCERGRHRCPYPSASAACLDVWTTCARKMKALVPIARSIIVIVGHLLSDPSLTRIQLGGLNPSLRRSIGALARRNVALHLWSARAQCVHFSREHFRPAVGIAEDGRRERPSSAALHVISQWTTRSLPSPRSGRSGDCHPSSRRRKRCRR
jgi:hypothetical protein